MITESVSDIHGNKLIHMKTKFLYTTIIFIACLFVSCKKAHHDINDYFPIVKTVSATIQTDGSVLMQGEIESEGDGPVENVGFCCGTQNAPEMLNRQIQGTISGTTFTATYTGNFSVDSIYYFRSFATNSYGYVYGNTLSLDSIIAPTVTPPCSLTMNTVNIGGSTGTYSYYSVSQPSEYMGTWTFDGQSGGPTITFLFGSGITTGIYTSTISSSPGAGQVYVSFYFGAISGALNSGSSIYVNTIGTNIYDISICNAPWLYNSSTFYCNTRMTVPL